jgi:hypothetical protein
MRRTRDLGLQYFCTISVPRSIYPDCPPKLVGARKPSVTIPVNLEGENECPAIGVAASARVPVGIGMSPESRILRSEALQGRIDSLLFRGRETRGYCALLQQPTNVEAYKEAMIRVMGGCWPPE